MKRINFSKIGEVQEPTLKQKTDINQTTETNQRQAEISEQDIKNNSQARTNIERARINMEIDDRDKADGRMVDSFGENQAKNRPIARFYPEDVARIAELTKKGDYAAANKLKKELIQKGKCFYQ